MSFPTPPADDAGRWLAALPPGRVLVREMEADRWWQLLPDHTRLLVGGQDEAMRLAASWRDDRGGLGRPAGAYTVAKVDPVVLDRWADVTPDRTFTKEFR